MFKILFAVGFGITFILALLCGANMIAYHFGFYRTGGYGAYLRRHYLLMVSVIVLVVILGVTHDRFQPPDRTAHPCPQGQDQASASNDDCPSR